MKKATNHFFKIQNFFTSVEQNPKNENIKSFRITKRLTNSKSPVQICLSGVRGEHVQPYVLRIYNALIEELGYYISSVDIYLVPYGIEIKKWREKSWEDCEKKIVDKINTHLSLHFI